MKRFMIGLLVVGLSSALFAGDRFVRDDAKEVVVDTKTNLMWQDDGDVKTVTKSWTDTIDYCEGLTLGGYDDWHLPNYNELYSLADRSRYNPSIDPAFQNVVSDPYWSSTTNAGITSDAGVVNFSNGYGYWDDKSLAYNVRCVRDN